MNEKVLVVPSGKVIEILDEREGLVRIDYSAIEDIITKFGTFIDRSLAEVDEGFRQVIPYVAMRQDGKFLVLRRTTKQGERRLHNKISLGVGGHINHEDDVEPWKAFLKGMEREIKEEVKVHVLKLSYLGAINDLSTPVSRVHIGISFVADVIFEGLNEPEMFTYSWRTLDELEKSVQDMEGWSSIIFQELKRLTQR